MTWEELDWAALDRLRDGFLGGGAAGGPYWRDANDLACYDFTYGERIGWKWDQVLRELRLRGWRPQSRDILDWGCGSGVASRRVLEFFGAAGFDSLTLWDHSPAACDFASEAATRAFPELRVASATPGMLAAPGRIGLLVISHVLNELSEDALGTLRMLALHADEVLWVEPGTHDVSRRLGRRRDDLRGPFRVVAPCTHQLDCPMFSPDAARDWCHFFAPPAPEIFADSNWVKFGQRAGIDLRSLPYSFVALSRGRATAEEERVLSANAVEGAEAAAATAGPADPQPGKEAIPSDAIWSRVIGRPEHFKPYARVLSCDATGLAELELPKRADPALFKQLERTKAPLVYRWRRSGQKLSGGEPLG